jgi:hypothetical protein
LGLKNIFYLVLTFCLLNAQFSNTITELSLANDAAAQVTRDDTDSGERNARMTQEQINAQQTERQKAQQTSGKTDDNSTGRTLVMTEQYVSLLAMLLIAVFGLWIAKACDPMRTDMYAAAIGAAAFIIGEVLSIFNTKEEIDFKGKAYVIKKDGTGNMEQAQAFEKLKEGYEAALKNAKTRSILQFAAAFAFGVAAGIALYTKYSTLFAAEACLNSITAQKEIAVNLTNACSTTLCGTPCTAQQATGKETCSVASCQQVCTAQQVTCIGVLSAYEDKINDLKLDGEIDEESLDKFNHTVTKVLNARQSLVVEKNLCPWTTGAAQTADAQKAVVEADKARIEADQAAADAKIQAEKAEKKVERKVAVGAFLAFLGPAFFWQMDQNQDQVEAAQAEAKAKKAASEAAAAASVAAADAVKQSIESQILIDTLHQAGIQTFSTVLPPLDATCGEFLREIEEEKTICDGTSPAANFDQFNKLLPPKYYASLENINKNNNKSGLKNILTAALEFLFPSASAEFNVRYIGLAVVVLAVVIFALTDSSPSWARWMGAPSGRAGIYLVAAGLAAVAGGITLAIIKEIEDYIEELEGIIAKLTGLGEGVQTARVSGGVRQQLNQSLIPKGGEIEIGVGGDGKKKFPCIKTDKNGKCKNLQGAIQGSVGFSSLPGALQQNANDLGQFGNSLQGTNTLSAGALDQAQGLAGQAVAARKRAENLLKETNRLNERQGNPPLGIKARAGLIKGNLFKSVALGLKKNGVSAAKAIASLGGSFAPRGKADVSDEALAAGAKKYLGVNNNKAGGSFSLPTRRKNNFSFDLDSDKEKSGQLHSGAVGDATGAEGYSDKNAADIVDSKDTNLFDIIHLRYLKTAYPTLLEEDK